MPYVYKVRYVVNNLGPIRSGSAMDLWKVRHGLVHRGMSPPRAITPSTSSPTAELSPPKSTVDYSAADSSGVDKSADHGTKSAQVRGAVFNKYPPSDYASGL